MKARNNSLKRNARDILNGGVGGLRFAAVPVALGALIPGTPHHTSAQMPCVSGSSGQSSRCQAFLIQRADNSATLVVTNPEGQKRQDLLVRG